MVFYQNQYGYQLKEENKLFTNSNNVNITLLICNLPWINLVVKNQYRCQKARQITNIYKTLSLQTFMLYHYKAIYYCG